MAEESETDSPYLTAYYWLQFDRYVPVQKREQARNGDGSFDLVPSYLQLDTQARVIRLETFSKVGSLGQHL